MRRPRLIDRLMAATASLALVLAACGADDEPAITVASFNFPESSILAEIYAQALEDAGYPVERELDLGSRELIFPELESGNLDFLPEYLGSSLMVGFGGDAPDDVDAGAQALAAEFEAVGVTVLTPSGAQNSNVFVTTAEFAGEHGLSSVADLADAGAVTFAGPPECEDRDTCYAGLQDTYGLANVEFESIQEPAARIAALEAGDVQLILMFSTDPPLASDDLVVLDEPQGMIAPENITPVLRTEIVEVYGDDIVALIDSVSAQLTTEALVSLNSRSAEGVAPAEIAGDWLAEAGLVG